MALYNTKLTVRDSFDDEDGSDDVDDEVFIRDGRNGYKADEERGVKRPLMAPRRKQKQPTLPDVRQKPRASYTSLLAPCCCYGSLVLTILFGLIALAVVIINFLPFSLDNIQFWKLKSPSKIDTVIIPCTDISVNDVWIQTFPKLTSETAVRLNDINKDGIMDIIIGYGTGADGRNVPEFVCKLYFNQNPPCLGGVLALDGKTGKILWQHWTHRPVFTLDCGADITHDGVNDCLLGGKGGILHVVNGHDGSLLWHLEDGIQRQPSEPVLDVYSAQYISDIDGDGFVDVIAAHTSTDSTGLVIKGHLMLVSGKAGRLLRMLDTPGSTESYYAPQLLVQPDGDVQVLFGTGGTAGQSWGGIHTVPLSQLASSDKLMSRALLMSDTRGVMSPAVLADINHDGTEDIIVSLFNSSIVAIDGITFLPLWNYSFPNSQTFSPPTPAYINDDDVPDFLVKYQFGPDFPTYYYSQTNIIDGKTGVPLLNHPVIDSIGSQTGGISLSVEGSGNDWILFWTADCEGHEGAQDGFTFAKGSSLVSQCRADLCRLRFNSTMSTTLWAINQHVNPPGVAIYSSEWRQILEFNNSKNIKDEAYRYLNSHPDFWVAYKDQNNPSTPAYDASDSSSNFHHKSPSLVMNRIFSPYDGDSYQGPQSQMRNQGNLNAIRGSLVGAETGTGEMEEMEDQEYARMQPHSVSKHRRPSLQWQQPKIWDTEQAGYGVPRTRDRSMYESPQRDPDYDIPVANSETLANENADNPRPLGDYNRMLGVSLLSGQRNERSGRKETAPTFLQAIHDKPLEEKEDLRSKRLNSSRKWKRESDKSRDKNTNSTSGDSPRGIYLTTSTGTLAPPLSGSGIDLILVSYWVPPAEGVQILLPKDVECVRTALLQVANDDSGKYNGMSPDAVESTITAECLRYRAPSNLTSDASENPSNSEPIMEPHPGFIAQATANSANMYNALNLRMGQLTVYRLNLQCQCVKVRPQNEKCANILPFEKQSWPSYLGAGGKGYFRQRD